MTGQPEAILALARDDLTTARRDLGAGYPRPAASRAYYAVFHAVSAALSKAGVPTKSHAGMRSQFSRVLVLDGPFETADAKALARLSRLRHDADYEVGRDVSVEAAREAVADAAALVERLAAWVASEEGGVE